MAPDFDAVIVGAGVIGLAIARHLACLDLQVLVLEKASRVGTETSSRNSEVIHAGIYYSKGSLKAKLCVEGRHQLYDYCASRDVAYKRIGKFIVATNPAEETKLRVIKASAEANGVDDLMWCTPNDVARREPELRCSAALFSPSTGIVDTAGFMLALQSDAETRGAMFAFNTAFLQARKQDSIFVIDAVGKNGETTSLTSRMLINCAGHGAHDVVTKVQNYPIEKCPPRYLAKGNYCSVSGASPFTHLIYPVPESGALGIHATLDLMGEVRLGPDIEWLDACEYSMPAGLAEKFALAVEPYWPGVKGRTLAPSYCGIRPKIHGPEMGFADFMIQFEASHGIAGFASLFGIESPGITASLALARHVADGLLVEDVRT